MKSHCWQDLVQLVELFGSAIGYGLGETVVVGGLVNRMEPGDDGSGQLVYSVYRS